MFPRSLLVNASCWLIALASRNTVVTVAWVGGVLSCFLGGATVRAMDAEDVTRPGFAADVRPLLQAYCIKCHGAKQQKGERRFDRLDGAIADDEVLVDYQDMLDQLNLGEMPPADQPQPSAKQRQTAIRWLTEGIDRYHAARSPIAKETVLRRLNSREYRNTVRDLFHLNTSIFDPTRDFPQDQTEEHLDNLGERLVVSGHLLARYLAAADAVVEKLTDPAVRPEVKTWEFNDDFRQQPEIDQVHRRTTKFKHLTLYEVIGADKHEGAYAPLLNFREGVPQDGYYEIRFEAEALNREHPYDDEFLGMDRGEPFRLGVRPGDYRVGALHKPQPVEPLLAEVELADGRKWYTVRVWLDEGYTPRFTFRNGMYNVRTLWSRVQRKYPKLFPKPKSRGIVEARYNAIAYGKLPQIHIHNVEIQGPLFDAWPTSGQRELLGDDWERARKGQLTLDEMRSHLRRLATRIFRRPAEEGELDRVMALIKKRRDAGRSPLSAYGDGVKALLVSPAFLYLDESTESHDSEAKRLSDYALASRLSYFLWSSTPDETLLQLAAAGRLHKQEVLTQQAERMLADPRSDAFVDGFLDSWLTLRELGATPPDRAKFPAFYHGDLGVAMREETRRFTRHLLDENLPLGRFLDADFTFVNGPLAKHYRLSQTPTRGRFAQVQIDDPRRGGLLGQASVLTVTANGIDTSPVTRGVWLLENLLGTPPSPPPPDVEPLDPDIRGAKTIRDQLAKHRDNPACADCHRKIDPLGFALENFDAIGGWRTRYENKAPVDAAGELPNGKSFEDVRGLKEVLLQQQATFKRALAEKLLAYATGRTLTPSDRPNIDGMLEELRASDGGFRDLIKQVVLSDPFAAP